jgi:tetratricopeptide (TPR) repeat protein
LTIAISSVGQTATIDNIKKDYDRGDFGLVIWKVKSELKSDTIINNRVYYYWMLANVYSLNRHFDSALYFVNKAIGLSDNVAYTLSERAAIYYSQKKYKEALTDINKAIQISPEWSLYYYQRAILYSNLKKKGLAKLDYEKVKELSKKENNQGLYNSAENALMRL